MSVSHVRLALDWTPNTIHTGFYVGLAKGWYEEAGISVEIISPEVDNYATSPAKKVELGKADVAIAPSESVISYQTKANPAPLRAVAAILARDASAIVTPTSRGITRPCQLDERIYASYAARFEDHIVRAMVRYDGGSGNIYIVYPERLDLWSVFEQDKADATWVFLPWEGTQAQMKGLNLTHFRLEDFGIPYGYSPVLLAHQRTISERADTLRDFLEVTRRSYDFAKSDPSTAATYLIQQAAHESLQDELFVRQSQAFIASYYCEDDNSPWGVMSPDRWYQFIQWLISTEILTDSNGEIIRYLDPDQLFTNQLLP